MESYESQSNLSEQERRRLVIEHASLASRFVNGDSELAQKLQAIEQQLGLSAEEVASEAMKFYKGQY